MANGIDDFKVGDIVEIVASSDEDAVGCLGEVVELGLSVKVAVVHLLPFQADQIRKHTDLVSLTWNDLRKQAKKLDLAVTGTRPELEAKIKGKLLDQGRVEKAKFAKDDIVIVIDTRDKNFDDKGTVTNPGPPVDVDVIDKDFKKVPRTFEESQIEKVS